MAYVKRIVSMVGYTLPNVQWGKQEESLLFVIDLEKDDDPTIVVRKAHNMIAELLWNGINHGAVAPAGAMMFKDTKWTDKQIERGVFFDLDGSSDAGDYEDDQESEKVEGWREKLTQIANDNEMAADALSDVDEVTSSNDDNNSDIPF